jgi:hypothetical protein
MTNAPTITLDWVRQEKAKENNRHRAKMADLDAVERVLLSAATEIEEAPSPAVRPEANGAYGSKKRGLLRIIADSTSGLTTQAIIQSATAAGLSNIRTATVSPKLSAYKSKGLLVLEHGVWRITSEGRVFLASAEE